MLGTSSRRHLEHTEKSQAGAGPAEEAEESGLEGGTQEDVESRPWGWGRERWHAPAAKKKKSLAVRKALLLGYYGTAGSCYVTAGGAHVL